MKINQIQKHIEWEKYYFNKFNWNEINFYKDNKLSEDFIREFQNNINWELVSQYQQLSEDFIREFYNRVDWYYISAYKKLSEDLTKEFQDKINWIMYFCSKYYIKGLNTHHYTNSID